MTASHSMACIPPSVAPRPKASSWEGDSHLEWQSSSSTLEATSEHQSSGSSSRKAQPWAHLSSALSPVFPLTRHSFRRYSRSRAALSLSPPPRSMRTAGSSLEPHTVRAPAKGAPRGLSREWPSVRQRLGWSRSRLGRVGEEPRVAWVLAGLGHTCVRRSAHVAGQGEQGLPGVS